MLLKSLSPIELYRQLKLNIRSNPKILIVGIDVSKDSSVACVADGTKHVYLKKFKFPNSVEGLNSIMHSVENIKQKHSKDIAVWALEPTGNFHKPIAHFLIKNNYHVVGVSTIAVKENRKTLDGRWRKSDPKDAYNIVDLVSQGKMYFYRHDPFSDGLKDLLRLRDKQVQRLSSIKIRLRNNHFARYFPEIDKLYADITNPEVLCVLKHFPTAQDISNVSIDHFVSVMERKPFTKKRQQRIFEIWSCASQSIACSKNIAVDVEMSIILEEIKTLKKNIIFFDQQIASLCKTSSDYKLLQTIPGFGPLLSAIFMAYVGPIKNYTKYGQVCKLIGLDLEYTQSGRFHSQASISKKGMSFLRYALCSAATRALNNGSLKEHYKNIVSVVEESSQSMGRFRIKLADKLLRAAYAVLKYQRPFDLKYFLNPVNQSQHLST